METEKQGKKNYRRGRKSQEAGIGTSCRPHSAPSERTAGSKGRSISTQGGKSEGEGPSEQIKFPISTWPRQPKLVSEETAQTLKQKKKLNALNNDQDSLKKEKKIAEEEGTEQSLSRRAQPLQVLDVHPSEHPTKCTLKQEQPHPSLGAGQGQGTSSFLLHGSLLF